MNQFRRSARLRDNLQIHRNHHSSSIQSECHHMVENGVTIILFYYSYL